jgi:hypothetical protein
MPRHLKTHGIELATQDQMKKFQLAMNEFDISMTTNIPIPSPLGPPIECLQITPDGYCCNHCLYCAPSLKAFQNHWFGSTHKNDKTPSALTFHRGAIQSFFNPSPQHWFEVNPTLATLSSLDPFAVYLKTEVPKFVRTLNEPPTHVREIPPLLKITGWLDHLEDHIKTKNAIRNIRSLVNLPPSKQTTGLGRLRTIVQAYMKDITKKGQSSSLGVKCLLMECPRLVEIQLFCIIRVQM